MQATYLGASCVRLCITTVHICKTVNTSLRKSCVLPNVIGFPLSPIDDDIFGSHATQKLLQKLLLQLYKFAFFKVTKGKYVANGIVCFFKMRANCFIVVAVTADGDVFTTKLCVNTCHLGTYHTFL